LNAGGWALGLLGMVLCLAGVMLPSTLLTWGAARWAHRNRGLRAVRAFKQGMTPVVLGLLLGLVGTDVNSGVARYSFDIPELTDGINFVVLAMGVFGYGEIIANLSKPEDDREVFTAKVQGLFPTKEDFKR
ncbi:tripartite tricarboxylate transporter permease, partial [Rhizobium sp. 18055]|uniref:tripartite tricarboxylate transporter permease n=1 Tax=Rhizobium sp. 18055 TaxID=2681403 RepID=UPI00190F7A01